MSRSWRAALLALVGAACSGGGGAGPAPSTESTVEAGPGGGTFTLGTITIVVPAGAVPGLVKLGARTIAALPGPLPSSLQQAGPVLELTRDGTGSFTRPLAVTVPFDSTAAPAVVHWDPVASRWLPVAVADYDGATRRVTFTTAHFSRFAIVSAPGVDGATALDTGFRPERDGLFHPAFGPAFDPGSASLGMVAYAQWYFGARAPDGAKALASAFREGPPCPIADGDCDLDRLRWEDDQVARELAARSFKAACGGAGGACVGSAEWSRFLPPTDPDKAGRLLLQTLAAGSPALLLVADGWPLAASQAWRAVLTYAWNGSAFLLYDPARCGVAPTEGAEPTCLPGELPWRDAGAGKRVFGAAGTTVVVRPSAFSDLGASADFAALEVQATAGFPPDASPFARVQVDEVVNLTSDEAAVRVAPSAFLIGGWAPLRIEGQVGGGTGPPVRSVAWWFDGIVSGRGIVPVVDGHYTIETTLLGLGTVDHVWLVASSTLPEDPAAPWVAFAGFTKLWIGAGTFFLTPEVVLAAPGDRLTVNGEGQDLAWTVIGGTGNPADCPYQVVLSSSDPAVVAVLPDGSLQAGHGGEATVTAACAWITGSCAVRVYPVDRFISEQWQGTVEAYYLPGDPYPAMTCEPQAGCLEDQLCCHFTLERLFWNIMHALEYRFAPDARIGHWEAVFIGEEDYARWFPLAPDQPACCRAPQVQPRHAEGLYTCDLVPAESGVPFSGGAGTAALWSSVQFTCGGEPGAFLGDANSYVGIIGAVSRFLPIRAEAHVWFGTGLSLGLSWQQGDLPLHWTGAAATAPPWPPVTSVSPAALHRPGPDERSPP